MAPKTVVELPLEDFEELRTVNRKILSALENLKVIPPPDFLSRKEFMSKCKIEKSKFDLLMKSGKLKYRKVGKFIYIPFDQVERYFNGELQ